MMLFFRVLASLLVIFASCSPSKTDNMEGREGTTPAIDQELLSTIVLVNGGILDRCQMGDLIAAVSLFHPQAIAINFIYAGRSSTRCDSILVKSMKNTDRLILIESFTKGERISSHPLFKQEALFSALSGLIIRDDSVVTEYYLSYSEDSSSEVTFPFLVALQSPIERTKELLPTLTSQTYPFTLSHKEKEFTIMSRDQIPEEGEKLTGKIVLIGYLGPSKEDLFITQNADGSVERNYGTVILSNVILDIIKSIE